MTKEVIEFFNSNGKKKVTFKRYFGEWDLVPIYNNHGVLIETKESSIRYNIFMLPFLMIASIYFNIKNIGRKGRVRRKLKRTK